MTQWATTTDGNGDTGVSSEVVVATGRTTHVVTAAVVTPAAGSARQVSAAMDASTQFRRRPPGPADGLSSRGGHGRRLPGPSGRGRRRRRTSRVGPEHPSMTWGRVDTTTDDVWWWWWKRCHGWSLVIIVVVLTRGGGGGGGRDAAAAVSRQSRSGVRNSLGPSMATNGLVRVGNYHRGGPPSSSLTTRNPIRPSWLTPPARGRRSSIRTRTVRPHHVDTGWDAVSSLVGVPVPWLSLADDAQRGMIPSALSALVTYLVLVTYYDRPRGTLGPARSPGTLRVAPSTVPGAGRGVFVTQSLPAGTVLGTYPGVLIPLAHNQAKGRRFPACVAYIWRFQDSQFVLDPTSPWDGSMTTETESHQDEENMADDVCRGGHAHYPWSRELFQYGYSRIISPRGHPTSSLSHVGHWFSSVLGPVPRTLARINEPPMLLHPVETSGNDNVTIATTSVEEQQRLQRRRRAAMINVETVEDTARRTVTFRLSRSVVAGEELFLDYGPDYDRSGYTGSCNNRTWTSDVA